jgi:hypothetical protein
MGARNQAGHKRPGADALQPTGFPSESGKSYTLAHIALFDDRLRRLKNPPDFCDFRQAYRPHLGEVTQFA